MLSFNPILNGNYSYLEKKDEFKKEKLPFLKICESYLAPLSKTKKAFTPSYYNPKSDTFHGQLIDRPTIPFWNTALKISTYATLILPLLAALGIIIYRSVNHFDTINEASIKKIQKAYRQHKAKKSLERQSLLSLRTKQQKAALVFQDTIRATLDRTIYLKKRKARLTLQTIIRGSLERNKFLKEKRAALILQSIIRGSRAKNDFNFWLTEKKNKFSTEIVNLILTVPFELYYDHLLPHCNAKSFLKFMTLTQLIKDKFGFKARQISAVTRFKQAEILKVQLSFLSRKIVQDFQSARLYQELGFYSKKLFQVFGGLDQFYKLPRFNWDKSTYIIQKEQIKFPVTIGRDIAKTPFLIFKYIFRSENKEEEEFEVVTYSRGVFKSASRHQEVTAYGACEALNDENIFLKRLKALLKSKPLCSARETLNLSKNEFYSAIFNMPRLIKGKPVIELCK